MAHKGPGIEHNKRLQQTMPSVTVRAYARTAPAALAAEANVRWTMKKVILAISFAVALFSCAANAGECTRRDASYLDALKSGSCESAMRCLSCVGIPLKLHARWGIASEMSHLQSKREAPVGEQIIMAAQQYIHDPSVREVAVMVLAFQGVSIAGDVDVFTELTERENYRFYHLRWYALASLQDSRTLDFVEREYRATRETNSSLTVAARESLMEIVDCLFHFPANESRSLLKKLAVDETDESLKLYIKRTAGV